MPSDWVVYPFCTIEIVVDAKFGFYDRPLFFDADDCCKQRA
jgi:hypothetical protein